MGRVALVTGAAHGIGRACAFRLAEIETEFSLVDRDEEGLLETATDLMKRAGRQPLQFVSDVTQPQEVHRVVAQTVQHFGRIDILVNCAGGADTKLPRPIDEMPLEAWDAQVDLNLRSVFVFCREVVPIMRAGKYGRIVNISSAAGRSTGRTKLLPYTAAKAGVLGLTRELARQVAPDGITVNAVCPGRILSGARAEESWNQLSAQEKEETLHSIPAGRLGRPEEIAAAVAFLASEEASYITGACLDVNGGALML
ncbi:MAG: hypothetical protein A3I10_07945 [Deltaproteobacteria bacterium RIFCSPLOWO2_02_FULL_57_26]|nr:MAG: hypothetical protein A3I10_07945 [Deltaproteobacteria bacterium RIFCSPLOWO2_02_FULL_57_26]